MDFVHSVEENPTEVVLVDWSTSKDGYHPAEVDEIPWEISGWPI